MNEMVIHWSVIVITIIAVTYPAGWACFFFKDKEGIGRPIAWMLLGEVIGRTAGLLFFFSTVLENFSLSNYSYAVPSVRVFIVMSGLCTTIILIRYLRKVQYKQ